MNQLQILKLCNNKIEFFPTNSIQVPLNQFIYELFQSVPVLGSLDLSNNKLTNITSDLFDRANMITSLNLAGNQIDCCEMLWAFDRMSNKRYFQNLKIYYELIRQTECGAPFTNVGKNVDQITEDTACIPTTTTTTTTTTITTTTTTTTTKKRTRTTTKKSSELVKNISDY